MDFYEI